MDSCGVAIDPAKVLFFIDDYEVAWAPQVAGGADSTFFITDVAFGGGWPAHLAGTGGREQMLVDDVRVCG